MLAFSWRYSAVTEPCSFNLMCAYGVQTRHLCTRANSDTHLVPCQRGSTHRRENKNTRRFQSPSVGTWGEKKWKRCGRARMSDDDTDVTKRRGDAVLQLLTCHTLICICLRLCLQAPRSCQAAVRKRAAGSQSCDGGAGEVGSGGGVEVRAQTTA